MKFVEDKTFAGIIIVLLVFAFSLYAASRNMDECKAKGFSDFYCVFN